MKIYYLVPNNNKMYTYNELSSIICSVNKFYQECDGLKYGYNAKTVIEYLVKKGKIRQKILYEH